MKKDWKTCEEYYINEKDLCREEGKEWKKWERKKNKSMKKKIEKVRLTIWWGGRHKERKKKLRCESGG